MQIMDIYFIFHNSKKIKSYLTNMKPYFLKFMDSLSLEIILKI